MERLARLGIFGGTFDPPHLGHLILAAEALDQLNLDRVLWVLTPEPPHKHGQNRQSLDDRLGMLHVAISEFPSFQLSRVDIDRSPPHYAVDTVRLLAQQYPLSELIYLIGGDSLRDLPRWHKPLELVAACKSLGVMRRPEAHFDLARLEESLPGVTRKILNIDAPASRDFVQRDPPAHCCRPAIPALLAGGSIFPHPRAALVWVSKRLRSVIDFFLRSMPIKIQHTGCSLRDEGIGAVLLAN